jgi:SAM-dependent methyltransferase
MASIPLTAAPSTDPTAIYGYRDCLYADDMLIAGLAWLDFFTWVAHFPPPGPTVADACRHFSFAPRPVDVMVTLFKARGFLTETNGTLTLTHLAREHLVKDSPWFIGPYYASLKERPVTRDLLEVLKNDRPANWGSQKDLADWHLAMEDDAFAEEFTAAMDCRGVFLAQAAAKSLDLSGRRHVLDIAGGSGIYACSLVAHHAHLRATVLEKPPVDRIAAKAIAKRGCADRVAVLAQDMLAGPLPGGCDVHLLSNVLHDWDVPVVKRLLAACRDALPPGGLLVIHDAFLNADKSGPRHVAEYSVLLLHATQGRCYGVGELRDWLNEAGFGAVTHRDTAAARGVMLAVKC